MKRVLLTLISSLMLRGLTSAQVMEKKTLSIEGARKVIAAAVAEAKRLTAPGGVIAVVDDGGNLMALERLDNTFAAGANISIGKARTAVLFKRPSVPSRFLRVLRSLAVDAGYPASTAKALNPLRFRENPCEVKKHSQFNSTESIYP